MTDASTIPTERYDYFDQLRAIAILPVLLHHFYSPAMPGGGLGVSVFFCLSGYFIYRTSIRRIGEPKNATSFLIRRTLRIYPLFLFAVLVTLGLNALATDPENYQIIRGSLGKLLIFGGADKWSGFSIGVMWTLAVEFWFYILFFSILIVAKNERSLIGMTIALIAVNIVLIALEISSSINLANHLPPKILFYMPQLLIGVLFAHCATKLKANRNLGGARWGVLASIFAIYYLVEKAAMNKFEFLAYTYVATLLTGLLILLFHLGVDRIKIPLLAFIGKISFSLYLVHAIVLDFIALKYPVFFVHGRVIGFLLYLLISVTISVVTYYLIEVQCMNLAKSMVQRLKRNALISR